MEITATQLPGKNEPVTVFHVTGEINTQTHEQLHAAMKQARDAGARNMVLDMTDVPYMSSAGLRLLSAVMKMLRTDAPYESADAMSKGIRAGTFTSPHLKLVNPSPLVKEVLHTSGLDMVLQIFRSVDDAVSTF
jgi:anti-anti-sigma regulatory factor